MKVPKNLLKNYHRLDKFYNRSESEDEDQYGLTVWRQIKILNDNNMTDEEKSEKLNSLWNQSKKNYENNKQDEKYVKEQEIKIEKSRKITMLRKELRDQKENVAGIKRLLLLIQPEHEVRGKLDSGHPLSP